MSASYHGPDIHRGASCGPVIDRRGIVVDGRRHLPLAET